MAFFPPCAPAFREYLLSLCPPPLSLFHRLSLFVPLCAHLSIVHIVTRWHPSSSYCFAALFDGGSLVRPPRPTATHCFLVVARPSVFSFSYLKHCELQASTSEPLSSFEELSGFPMSAEPLIPITVPPIVLQLAPNRVFVTQDFEGSGKCFV